MLRYICFFVSFCLVLPGFTAELFADFVVVDEKTPPCPIVIAKDAGGLMRMDAETLAKYLKEITGAEFAIEHESTGRCIELILDPELNLSIDGHSWHVTDEKIVLKADNMRGMSYVVFGFLEQACGCRWWSQNEQFVPRNTSLTIKNQEVLKKPAFLIHQLFNREADHYSKRGLTIPVQFIGEHSLYPLLAEYAKDHPEIYPADAEGKRASNDLHFCYLAPGIAEALTEALDARVREYRGNVTDYIYFAGMGDWYGGQCQCEKCKAVYEEEKWTNPDGTVLPGYTGTLLRMINTTAEALEKMHPGIRIGTFAYMSLEAPPAITKPRENVVIRVPRLRHCTVHAANECQGNRQFCLNLERWQQIAPGRVYVWDYGANFTNFLLPFPTLNSMAENIKYYHQLGIAGVMIQGNYVSTGGDAAVMKNYVWSKLFWEPDRSTQELTEEFCRGYYGPAANDVLAYVNALENSVRLPELKHADEFANPANVYLNEALLVELREHLQHALNATKGEANAAFNRRVLELQVSIEAAVLWKPGPLADQPGKLVRTDLGDDSYARALALIEHCRNASPKEQGEGTLYRQQFLQLHGGPAATLAGKEISLRAAPVQAGTIGPITFGEASVIDSTTVQPGAEATNYKFSEKPTKDELAMSGECGIAHWGPTPLHLALLHVKLLDTGVIEMHGSVQRLNHGAATAKAVVATTYPMSEQEEIEVQWQQADGHWTTFYLNKESRPATCRGLVTLKIMQPVNLKTGRTTVEVNDAYSALDPKQQSTFTGTLTFDAAKGQLTTHVQTEVTEISAEAPKPYLKRTLSITSAK